MLNNLHAIIVLGSYLVLCNNTSIYICTYTCVYKTYMYQAFTFYVSMLEIIDNGFKWKKRHNYNYQILVMKFKFINILFWKVFLLFV